MRRGHFIALTRTLSHPGEGGFAVLSLLMSVLLLCGCSPTYVLRAGFQEAKILWSRRPITEVLADPALGDETRAKLSLVLEVRDFAKTIGLRVNGGYSTLAQVDANQVGYNVVAAQRLRLELYTWWFPFAGRVPYKGFFDEQSARDEAHALEQQGLDAIVLPVVAFSTLGWFDDPLFSSLLRHDRVMLANVVLHELLHNTVYERGQAEFNESFANFVGCRGAIAYFSAHDGPAAHTTERAQMLWDDTKTFAAFLEDFSARLRAAYEAGLTLEERERFFRDGQAELNRLQFFTDAYREFGQRPLNNAMILYELVYHRGLGLFEAAYDREGGDLAASIRKVSAVADGAPDPFAALRADLGVAPPTPAALVARRDRAYGVRRGSGALDSDAVPPPWQSALRRAPEDGSKAELSLRTP